MALVQPINSTRKSVIFNEKTANVIVCCFFKNLN